jgi:glycosyltransferase involved in cell wall biosynthesis
MQQFIISVIVPVYNRIDFLKQTIESVLAQTSDAWELILVDDGSTDGSWELAMEYSRTCSKIKSFRREKTEKGAPVCRNEGAILASGDYLIFLDSDDLLAPYCIEQRCKAISENISLDYLVFPTILFKNEINDLNLLANIVTDEDNLNRFLKRDFVWRTTCPVWKKESYQKIGGYNEILLCYQDVELNIRALAKGLSYKYFSDYTPDNYYCINNTDSISMKKFSKEYLQSQREMLNIVYLLLKETYQLSDIRKKFLVQFFLQVAIWNRFLNDTDKFKRARGIWKDVAVLDILSKRQYFLGLIFIILKFIESRININFLNKLNTIFSELFIKELIRSKSETLGLIRYRFSEEKLQ